MPRHIVTLTEEEHQELKSLEQSAKNYSQAGGRRCIMNLR